MEGRPPDSTQFGAAPPPASQSGPQPPPPPAGGALASIPWEEAGLDVFSGFFRTIGLVLRSPRRAVERVPLTTSLFRPFAFGFIVHLIAVWCSTFWEVALRGVWSAYVPTTSEYQLSTAVQIIGGMAAPLWVPVALLISVALQHLFLVIVGGAKNGFGATLRAMSYAYAPQILALVPLCGAVVGTVWSVVLVVIGLSVVHRISIGRALLSVLLPVVLCCACAALAMAFFGTAIMAALSSQR